MSDDLHLTGKAPRTHSGYPSAVKSLMVPRVRGGRSRSVSLPSGRSRSHSVSASSFRQNSLTKHRHLRLSVVDTL
jgi:hypothetical protein